MNSMRRLAESCVDDGGSADVDLDFRRAGNLREMVGTARAMVRVRCARCLEPMDLSVDVAVNLIVLRPGERDDIVESGSDVLVVDTPVQLSALIEDELLLAMPMFLAHAPGACPCKAGSGTVTGRPHPFAVLKGTKKTDR